MPKKGQTPSPIEFKTQSIKISKTNSYRGLFNGEPKNNRGNFSNPPPTQKETVQNLRNLIRNTVPETVEIVKNGKIVYKLSSKDFVWISHFQYHVDLEFAMGASLDSGLLKNRGIEEKNENVRHLEVGDYGKQKTELTRLLKQAATLGFRHCENK